MQDTEFTIEDGQLFMLQTRNAKRPAQAAVRFACDAVDEGLLSKEEALLTIDPGSLDAAAAPDLRPQGEVRGARERRQRLAGRGQGRGRLHGRRRPSQAEQDGRDVILVRPFTEADDVAGFHAAKGILTSEGGKASHAALVARGMGRPAVVGASALKIDLGAKTISVDGTTVNDGDFIAIDGTKGCVTIEDVPLIDARVDEYFDRVLEWADELRRLEVRANADDPEGAKKARELGAEGIGLCRTEHMFMAEDRQPKMRAMIMADDEEERRERARRAAAAPAGGLRGPVRGDGRPAGDDPAARPAAARVPPEPPGPRAPRSSARGSSAPTTSRSSRRRSSAWRRSTRRTRCSARAAVRLGILYPEIYEMQVEAIMRAAAAVVERDGERAARSRS